MRKKVTIQDIADALGISRNTVSKAINNTDGIADATREMILLKATEMGYKQFSYINLANSAHTITPSLPDEKNGATEIALFTTMFLTNSHFASLMLDKVQQDLSLLGYTLNTHRITREHIDTLSLPSSFHQERTAAILCVEMFDRRYDEMVCGLGLPVLFVDAPAKLEGETLAADQLYMENKTEIITLVNDMIKRGVKKIGFIGNFEHCQSFYERYMGFRWAMLSADVPVDEKFIIKAINPRELKDSLGKLDELPELFICANDFVAMDTVHALEELGHAVPDDVMISGFDDAAESILINPHLTTVRIRTQGMAFSAVQLLMTRIKEPSLDYRTVYTETELIYRESTEQTKSR